MSGQPNGPGVLQVAGRVLDPARGGRPDERGPDVDAGVRAHHADDEGVLGRRPGSSDRPP